MNAMAQKLPIHESPEAEIVRQIEDLIRLMAAGKAEPKDIQRLRELQKRRVDMLLPKRVHA